MDTSVPFLNSYNGLLSILFQSMNSYMWLQTADGLIQQVEQDVALFCPFICHAMLTSGGSSEAHPIVLPETVTSTVLGAILDYCQFHHLPGRSNLVFMLFNEYIFRWFDKFVSGCSIKNV